LHSTVRDAMPELVELLRAEPDAGVRVVLGHFMFVYIHPYMDGNGRMGRLLMNLMLASGGYPWTVVPVERRDDYLKALEAASVGQNVRPFSEFLAVWSRKLKRQPARRPRREQSAPPSEAPSFFAWPQLAAARSSLGPRCLLGPIPPRN
jgi:fido (protein-threonine AMPylation protein)